MAFKRKYPDGPFIVVNISPRGSIHAIVRLIDPTKRTWRELFPPERSMDKAALMRKALRMNERYEKDKEFDLIERALDAEPYMQELNPTYVQAQLDAMKPPEGQNNG